MTMPIVSISAAILYFAWFWYGRSDVDRRENSSTNQPTKETTLNFKTSHCATCSRSVSKSEITQLENQATIIRNEITQ